MTKSRFFIQGHFLDEIFLTTPTVLEYLLNVRLTIDDRFHSHFETLSEISEKELPQQVTIN